MTPEQKKLLDEKKEKLLKTQESFNKKITKEVHEDSKKEHKEEEQKTRDEIKEEETKDKEVQAKKDKSEQTESIPKLWKDSKLQAIKRAKVNTLRKGGLPAKKPAAKLKESAEELQEKIDIKVKSLALDRFAIAKTKRLKILGNARASTSKTIHSMTKIEETDDNFLEKSLGNVGHKLSTFGVSKKYLGLSAEEVLEKVNAIPKEALEDKENDNKQKAPNFDNAMKEKENKAAKSDSSSNDSSSNDSKGDVGAVSSDDSAKGLSGEPLKLKANPDTDTADEIKRNNEKIYDYLVANGELDAANYILGLMKPKDTEMLKTSDLQQNTKAVNKLSDNTVEMKNILDKIEEDMIDEQDTSVERPVKQVLQEKVDSEKKDDKPEKKKDEKSWFWSLLRLFLPSWLVGLLKTASALLPFATMILSAGFGWLKGKFFKLFDLWLSPYKKIWEGLQKGWKWIKGKISLIKNFKIFGRKPFAKLFGGKDAPDKIDKKTPKKTSNNKMDLENSKDSKSTESKNGKDGKSTDGKDGKSTDGKDGKSGKRGKSGKTGKSGKSIKSGKSAKSAKKLSALKKLKKGVGGKATGILKKLLRFTKPIPLLGTAIAAGSAIYAAQDGYRHADEILGIEKPTTLQKLASAAGSVVNDVSFGVLSTKGVAEKIIDWTTTGPAKEAVLKYEKEGILDYDRIGNSEVEDWDRLGKLPSKEIQKIINFDDWSDEDKTRMKKLYDARVAFENANVSENEETDETNTDATKTEPDATSTDVTKSKSETPESALNNDLSNSENKQKKISDKYKGDEKLLDNFGTSREKKEYKDAKKESDILKLAKKYQGNPDELKTDLEKAKNDLESFETKNDGKTYDANMEKEHTKLSGEVSKLEKVQSKLSSYKKIKGQKAQPNSAFEGTSRTAIVPSTNKGSLLNTTDYNSSSSVNGSSGVNGSVINGSSGVNGSSGSSGSSGINGVNGSSGINGVDGSGINGSSGVNGIDGSSGIDGIDSIKKPKKSESIEIQWGGETLHLSGSQREQVTHLRQSGRSGEANTLLDNMAKQQKAANTPKRPESNKEKAMRYANETERFASNATKAKDAKNAGMVAQNTQQVVINNSNQGNQEEHGAFDIYDSSLSGRDD